MRPHSARRRLAASGFSLIELLVTLSILAVVAALIVPRYLAVRQQAQVAVIDANNKAISNATNQWQALGGRPPVSPDQWVAFKMLQFLSTPSDGSRPQRGFDGDPTYPTDSLGAGGSYTISINAAVNAAAFTSATGPSPQLTQASQADGFYTNQTAGTQPSQAGVVTQNGALVSTNSRLYEKQGSLVYAVDYDLATAIFIRTGTAIGESGTPGTLP